MSQGLYEIVNNINKQIKSICCKIEALANGGGSAYKVYTALLKGQFLNGNWTVTATVLENTLGNITFTVNTSTDVTINSNNLFIQNKTVVFYTAYTGDNNDTFPGVFFNRADDNTIGVNVSQGLDFLSLAPIEIRVYN